METTQEETPNKWGLSKKTNVAVAAITGITVSCNAQLIQSIVATATILIIALYCVHVQGHIDRMKANK
jgi:hypothetical protein